MNLNEVRQARLLAIQRDELIPAKELAGLLGDIEEALAAMWKHAPPNEGHEPTTRDIVGAIRDLAEEAHGAEELSEANEAYGDLVLATRALLAAIEKDGATRAVREAAIKVQQTFAELPDPDEDEKRENAE